MPSPSTAIPEQRGDTRGPAGRLFEAQPHREARDHEAEGHQREPGPDPREQGALVRL
ncbi:MAG: hypothetical protein WKG01_26860 [Kofleriaceae bacterium]